MTNKSKRQPNELRTLAEVFCKRFDDDFLCDVLNSLIGSCDAEDLSDAERSAADRFFNKMCKAVGVRTVMKAQGFTQGDIDAKCGKENN